MRLWLRVSLLLWLLCHPSLGSSQQPPSRPKAQVGGATRDQQRPQFQARGSQDSPFIVKLDSIQANAQDKRGTPASPLVVKLDSIQAKAQAEQAEQQGREETSANWWIVRFTAALVLIGFFQAIFFVWQLVMIRKSLADTEAAADAAMKSAKSAESSVTLAGDTAKLELRAYIAVRSNGLAIRTQGEEFRVEWQTEIKNTGRTPAYFVVPDARMEILPLPLHPDWQLPPDLANRPGDTTINPDDRQPHIVRGKLSRADYELIRHGSGWALYVFGRVRYKDIYKVTHYTYFCWWAARGEADGVLRVEGVSDRYNNAD
jgi:hypothetical protein